MTPLPPIHRDCRRLLVQSEDRVRPVSNFHKCTVGTNLGQGRLVQACQPIGCVASPLLMPA